jgi:hypothetical protein
MQFILQDEMDKKINAPSLADAVSEEMKAQLNNFHHTLNHGLGVVKSAIDELVTKDDMHEISSAISTIIEKRIGATLSSSTKKTKNNACSSIYTCNDS